jgi:hypothetical protein
MLQMTCERVEIEKMTYSSMLEINDSDLIYACLHQDVNMHRICSNSKMDIAHSKRPNG